MIRETLEVFSFFADWPPEGPVGTPYNTKPTHSGGVLGSDKGGVNCNVCYTTTTNYTLH